MTAKGNEVMVVENLRGDDWRALAAIGNGKVRLIRAKGYFKRKIFNNGRVRCAVVAKGGAYIAEQ